MCAYLSAHMCVQMQHTRRKDWASRPELHPKTDEATGLKIQSAQSKSYPSHVQIKGKASFSAQSRTFPGKFSPEKCAQVQRCVGCYLTVKIKIMWVHNGNQLWGAHFWCVPTYIFDSKWIDWFWLFKMNYKVNPWKNKRLLKCLKNIQTNLLFVDRPSHKYPFLFKY